jgi:hypothetical protein
MANRPVSKSDLIPAAAFEFEKAYLIKLPPYIHPPYLVHYRQSKGINFSTGMPVLVVVGLYRWLCI